MIKNYLVHKRNTSESLKIEPKPKSSLEDKVKKIKASWDKNKSATLSLVEKSGKKQLNKHTVVEQLNQPQQTKQNPFFAFGQRLGNGHKNWNLNIDKISQVQDSNSRRDFTSHRSARQYFVHDKQNYNNSNIEQGLRKSTKSKKNKRKSKQKSSKSRNQKSKSTMSLSRLKNNNSKQLELRTERMQKSVKMLWECMGELWENSRVSQYKSEKNNQSINTLKRKLQEQQQKLLQIKFQILKTEKNIEKTHIGLRA